jgi:hypothetical protein
MASSSYNFRLRSPSPAANSNNHSPTRSPRSNHHNTPSVALQINMNDHSTGAQTFSIKAACPAYYTRNHARNHGQTIQTGYWLRQ